jgi:hypothetical protein
MIQPFRSKPSDSQRRSTNRHSVPATFVLAYDLRAHAPMFSTHGSTQQTEELCIAYPAHYRTFNRTTTLSSSAAATGLDRRFAHGPRGPIRLPV